MQDKEQISEVEVFFYTTQSKLGGNLLWEDLPAPMQLRYIDCINFILEVAQHEK